MSTLFDREEEREPRFAEVLVSRPARGLDRPFTYAVPERLRGEVALGSLVFVPLGKQRLSGYVVGFADKAPGFALRDVIAVLADEPVFDAEQLELARWLAERYRAPLADALRCVLPPGASQRPVVTLRLTETGIAPEAFAGLERAPRQRLIVEKLAEAGGALTRDELERVLRKAGGSQRDGVSGAITALEGKGLLSVSRDLRPPSARERTRLVAVLGESEEPWEEVVDALAVTAPRQAEVLAQLLASTDDSVPLAELPRAAVKALEGRGLVHVTDQVVQRLPGPDGFDNEQPHSLNLTSSQQEAFDWVKTHLERPGHKALLLRGVTGSGKTEVYLQCIDEARRRGLGAIVLVPEISLTPQMVGRFRARFGHQLALLHSALSAGERFDEWQRLARGEATIVVGARSAVFAPVSNLGIIVVDEEHERAYKQDSSPRYHAVAVAHQRARQTGAVLLMGSATPSVESYHFAQSEDHDEVKLLELRERIGNRPMPGVELIDLRKELLLGKGSTFSIRMHEEIQQCIGRGEQVILFLNRRGFSTFVMCRECGTALRCPDCAVSLIYHHGSKQVRCHHCDYTLPVPDQCPTCQGYEMRFEGLGTERVADQVAREFEGAVVARMDRDTVAHKGGYGEILGRFARMEANVLVGTQMIAKGLHFPLVTLVAVLNADVGLHRPDFRAAEQTFQLLTQVSGRAGREERPGIALVQTYNPDHYAVAAAAGHDYEGFCRTELAARRQNMYPPYVVLANLVFSDERGEMARHQARRCALVLEEMGLKAKEGATQFVGPAPAPLQRLRGRYRWQLLLKAPDVETLHTVLNEMEPRLGETDTTTMLVDVEPYDMM